MTDDDDTRLDAGIVKLFADKAEGWEFLTVLPDDALAHLRQLQRRGKLDKARPLVARPRADTLGCGGSRRGHDNRQVSVPW